MSFLLGRYTGHMVKSVCNFLGNCRAVFLIAATPFYIPTRKHIVLNNHIRRKTSAPGKVPRAPWPGKVPRALICGQDLLPQPEASG